MSPDFAQKLDELLDRSLRTRLKDVADELAGSVREECATLITSAADQARAEAIASGDAAVGSLAQRAKKIRSAQAVTEIAAALVEAASAYCGRAALFIHRGDRALGFRIAGATSEEIQLEFQKLSIVLTEAPVLAHVMERLEPKEALGDPEQLGAATTALLGLTPEDRVSLLPVALRDKVLAVLYVDAKGPDGQTSPIQSSAIEVLVALAEAWIEAVGNRKKLVAA